MFDDIPRLERHVRHLDWLIIKLNEKNVKLNDKLDKLQIEIDELKKVLPK